MSGWNAWDVPSAERPHVEEQPKPVWPLPEREQYREIVWDRGMPQESRERIEIGDPRWFQADKI